MILLKLGDYESVSTLSISKLTVLSLFARSYCNYYNSFFLQDTIRMNPLTSTEKFEFWLSKLGHLIIHFVIPLYFLPLTHVVRKFYNVIV